MNYKSENFRNQASPASSLSNSNCVEIAKSLSFSKKDILNYIIGVSNRCEVMYFTQETIADNKHVDVTRETVNRGIAELDSLGLITKTYRHMTSCLYTLHHAFQDIDVRNSLRNMYTACKYLPLSILMSLGDEMKSLSSIIGINQANQRVYVENGSGTKNVTEGLNKDRDIYKSYSTSHVLESGSGGQAPPPTQRSSHGDIKSGVKRPNSHIKGLNLTEAGCIKLLAYPPGAIEAALQALRQHKGEIRDPFVFFSKLCLNYCRDNDIHVDWGICFNELRRKGYEKSAVGIDSKNPYLYYTEQELDTFAPKKPKGDRIPGAKYGGNSIYDTASIPSPRTPETDEQKAEGVRKLVENASSGNVYAAILLGLSS